VIAFIKWLMYEAGYSRTMPYFLGGPKHD
jgi:hypothetical protein